MHKSAVTYSMTKDKSAFVIEKPHEINGENYQRYANEINTLNRPMYSIVAFNRIDA